MKIKMEIATCQIFYTQIQWGGGVWVTLRGLSETQKAAGDFESQSSLLGALIDYSNLPA